MLQQERRNWTHEEDDALKEAVQIWGDKDWQKVAMCLSGRTGQQCLHRWLKTLEPSIRRGRWSMEEDKALTLAIKAYGDRNWIFVQQHVPGRTDAQCRERWMNVISPELKVGPWTPEEDQKLFQAVEKNGTSKWSAIAREIPPRTDNQCRRRWNSISHKIKVANSDSPLPKRGRPPFIDSLAGSPPQKVLRLSSDKLSLPSPLSPSSSPSSSSSSSLAITSNAFGQAGPLSFVDLSSHSRTSSSSSFLPISSSPLIIDLDSSAASERSSTPFSPLSSLSRPVDVSETLEASNTGHQIEDNANRIEPTPNVFVEGSKSVLMKGPNPVTETRFDISHNSPLSFDPSPFTPLPECMPLLPPNSITMLALLRLSELLFPEAEDCPLISSQPSSRNTSPHSSQPNSPHFAIQETSAAGRIAEEIVQSLGSRASLSSESPLSEANPTSTAPSAPSSESLMHHQNQEQQEQGEDPSKEALDLFVHPNTEFLHLHNTFTSLFLLSVAAISCDPSRPCSPSHLSPLPHSQPLSKDLSSQTQHDSD